MNKWIIGGLTPTLILLLYFSLRPSKQVEPMCVFKTLMREQSIGASLCEPEENSIGTSLQNAEQYIMRHQNRDGGWSCSTQGSNNLNPNTPMVNNHSESDGAATAAVIGALRKLGYRYGHGSMIFDRGVDYLMKSLSYDLSPQRSQTQIQRKLGINIDLVMATNILLEVQNDLDDNHQLVKHLAEVLPPAIKKLEDNMEGGRLKGGTWAGVLQSSYAYNALSQAQKYGYTVDVTTFETAKNYQTSNYSLDNDEVKVADGAGILLYAVSGTLQSAGDDVLLANKTIAKAKANGKINESGVNVENLIKSGMTESEAIRVNTNVKIYEATKSKSLQNDVIKGYGNDGGEEYLSFLQTAETLQDNQDKDWAVWFNKISNRLISTQHSDGHWQGHHCITSPVFCTATCMSILAINPSHN